VSSNPRRLFILPLLLAFLGCRTAPTPVHPRYAVLPFENLSGDPSLDWAARAAAETLPWSLAGVMSCPVVSASALELGQSSLGAYASERSAALVTGANQLISGYVEKVGNRVRITAVVEDAATGKSIRTESVESATPAGALRDLAKKFSPSAKPYLTSNDTALRLYASGEPAQAVQQDRHFGPPWLTLERIQRAQGNREGALATIEQASLAGVDPASRAQLDLDAATLRGDKPVMAAALRRMSALNPDDTLVLRTLAEADSAAGNFPAAAADWQKLAAAIPADAAMWNSLGYARAWAGDYPGAMNALREYARLDSKSANPSDSMGDVAYLAGKFQEAATHYLDADAKDPKFLQHGELYKAAWARFRAGDRAGADSLFDRFFQARTAAGDFMVALQKGDWLYRTGRRKDAEAWLHQTLLRQSVAQPQNAQPQNPALRSDAVAQLAIWDLMSGDRAAAAGLVMPRDLAPSRPLVLVRFASLPSAPAEEWQKRADQFMPLPAMAGLRRLAVGYALLLDGHRDAALPVWTEIVKENPATDFFAAALVARLEGKKPAHELVPDPVNLNQFAALFTEP
jgi:tetratricopeptide (TPR) repeat protein/TolB-like protein